MYLSLTSTACGCRRGAVSLSSFVLLTLSLGFLDTIVSSASAGPFAYRKSPSGSRRMYILPKLEVKLLSGDFEQWGGEKVVYHPEILELRWGSPVYAGGAIWEIDDEPFETTARLASGDIPEPPLSHGALPKWSYFKIHLAEHLPAEPPESGSLEFYLRVMSTSPDSLKTPTVKIVYKKDESSTRFTAAGLYPELFRPMPIFIHLDTFKIIKADEEDDEEPYIFPVILYMDGTTLDVNDLAHSSVRIAVPARAQPHGNIPRYNGSIGSGDNIYIADDVGRFENAILPINMELADDPLIESLFGFRVDYTHLTKATTVWVLLLAMEEDATSDDAIAAAREAFLQGLQTELNSCIQSLTLPDVIRLVQNGLTLKELLKGEDASICGYTATEDASVLDQVRSKLKQMAKDAAKGEELDDAMNWLPGGITNLLDNIADHDDVIGFAHKSFTYQQLWQASRPVDFEFDIHLLKPGKFPSAETRNVHYKVEGSIGRCQHVPGKARCQPVVELSEILRRR